MSVVPSVTPESRPPITPASATGFAASAITRFFSLNSTVVPSSTVSFSPALARRTTTRLPSSLFKSKVCSGCPSSISTKFVTSTTLLMERRPMLSRRSTIHLGDGPIFTLRITRPM